MYPLYTPVIVIPSFLSFPFLISFDGSYVDLEVIYTSVALCQLLPSFYFLFLISCLMSRFGRDLALGLDCFDSWMYIKQVLVSRNDANLFFFSLPI
jgi:hypothetical protein